MERRTPDDFETAVFLALLVFAAGVFYLVPWAPVYVPALLLVAYLTFLRLDLALVLVVLFCPFFMLPKHFGSKEFAPAEVFLLLDVAVGALWIIDPERRSRLALDRLVRSPFLLPGGVLLLAAGISTILAVDRHDAVRAYREVLLEPAVFFALLALLATHRSHWRTLFFGLIGAGIVVAIVGLYQFATGHGLSVTPGTSVKRVPSVYGSADNVGLLFDRVLPVWFSFLLFQLLATLPVSVGNGSAVVARGADRLGHLLRRTPSALGLPGALLLLLGLLMLVTLGLSYSRGAWIALSVAALFVLTLMFSWGRWLAIACGIVVVLALVAKGPSIAHTLNSGHSGTTQQRLNVWHSAITMVKHKPIFGIGPDNFLHYYAPTRRQNLYQRECAPGLGYIQPGAGSEPCLSHPHDEILDFWLSAGILGLAAFVWLEVLFWRILLSAYRRATPARRVLAVGAMAAMLAALLHGLVDNSYFLPDLSIIFWLLCAFASYEYFRRERNGGPGGREPAAEALVEAS